MIDKWIELWGVGEWGGGGGRGVCVLTIIVMVS